MITREDAIAIVLKMEGGYANVPGDPGGCTKYGITQATLNSFQHLPTIAGSLTPTDVKYLTDIQAAWIYRTVNWVQIRGDDLPAPLACLLLNASINMGQTRAVTMLQEIVGPNIDGIMGGLTVLAVKGWRSAYMPEQSIAEEYAAYCAVRYAELNGPEGKFELGWFRRLFRVYTLAVST